MANDAMEAPAGANEAKGAAPNELSDDQLDKVAGGFGMMLAGSIGNMINRTVKTVSTAVADELTKHPPE